jgi:hypothetical protein
MDDAIWMMTYSFVPSNLGLLDVSHRKRNSFPTKTGNGKA